MEPLIFRAWDKKFNVMLPEVAVFNSNNIVVTDVCINLHYDESVIDQRLDSVEPAGPEHYCITGDIEVTQFTGRMDIDNTPIFYGDIIRHGESIREVVQVDCRCIAKRVKGNEAILLCFSEAPKVLGNKFQNPDLLL
jgi:hypothetical protein